MQTATPRTLPSKATTAHALKNAAAQAADAKQKQRRTRIAIATALGLILAIWYFWPNAQAAKVRRLQNELFGASASSLSPEDRKQKSEALRAETEKLSSADRKEVRKDMEKQFQNKMNNEAVQYLAMSPADRRKFIDGKLAKEKAAQQKRPAGAPGGAVPAAGTAVNAVNGVAVGAKGPGGGPGGKGPASPEDQDARRRSMLLHGSAEARAGMDQIRLDMATRRAQLGLPATSGKGGPR